MCHEKSSLINKDKPNQIYNAQSLNYIFNYKYFLFSFDNKAISRALFIFLIIICFYLFYFPISNHHFYIFFSISDISLIHSETCIFQFYYQQLKCCKLTSAFESRRVTTVISFPYILSPSCLTMLVEGETLTKEKIKHPTDFHVFHLSTIKCAYVVLLRF